MSDLQGLDANDPRVHTAVLNSLHQMPFRDLVAAIEGEEAAAAMDEHAFAATPVAPNGPSYLAASRGNGSYRNGVSEGAHDVPMSSPASGKRP